MGDNQRRQELTPLIDGINYRYGRGATGFGLLPPDMRAFKGHAAFRRMPDGRGRGVAEILSLIAPLRALPASA